LLRKREILIMSLLCLTFLLIIPFAASESIDDNQTLTASNTGDILKETKDYYFNSSATTDGDGSLNNPYNYLRGDRIVTNSTLHFADGEYCLNDRVGIDNVTIIGQSSETIISSYGFAFIVNGKITLNNVKLNNASILNYGDVEATNTVFANGEGIKFTSGNSFGGAIYTEYIDENQDSRVTIRNCTFENNNALYGGAICMQTGLLEVYDSSFISNHAYFYGGAISCEYCANMMISKSRFIKNYCIDGAGGAIYALSSGLLNMDNVTINASSAEFGAGITILNTAALLNNINAWDNIAEYDGGAIYHMYQDFTLSNSNFINNTASNGGAIFIDNSTLSITGNSFINNTASYKAGAIYSIFNVLTNDIELNAFENNEVFQTDEFNIEIGGREYLLFKLPEGIEIPEYLPSYYRLNETSLTSVKDQKQGGNCWSFTALAVLESCIKRITGIEYDFSEENMKNIMSLYSDYGWTVDPNDGGYTPMAWAYLTSWLGPVIDADDEYSESSVLSPVLDSLMHVQNMLFISRYGYNDNDAIKKAILMYGAVATNMLYHDNFMNGTSYYFYHEGDYKTDHAVTLVGWDDNYSKDNFLMTPEGDGAWIVKNSWGSDWGDEGYFYVSYYDTQMALGDNIAYTFVLNDTYRFDRNYQYDIAGPTNPLYNGGSNFLCKNIFNATGNGVLKVVSTYFYNKTNWTVSVKVNDILKSIKTGTSEAGYWTIILDDDIYLQKGDVFEVLFNITAEGVVNVPVSFKKATNHFIDLKHVSYISDNGGRSWTDLMEKYEAVLSIKAFVISDDINTSTALEVTHDGYNPVGITATVLDENGNTVDGSVKFKLNDDEFTMNLTNGRASFEYNFEKGINNITVTFEREGYITSSNTTSIEIRKRNTELSLNLTRKVNNLSINVTAKDNVNETIIIIINEQAHTANLVNGQYGEELTGLDNGNYAIKVSLNSTIWEAENATGSIDINIKDTQIIAGDLTANDEATSIFKLTLRDEDGTPLPNRTIEYELVTNSTVKTDDEGVAAIPFKLTNGNYIISLRFHGDNDYWPSSASKEITVKTNVNASIAVKTSLHDASINITFSKPINETITVSLDGNKTNYKLYDGSTLFTAHGLANGIHNVSVELLDEKYNYTKAASSFTINVIKTKITADNFTTIEYSKENYTVRLTDENDNPLSGKQVKFLLNNETICINTDGEGAANIPINLKGGTYEITVSYNNISDNYDDIEVTRTIKVKTIVSGEISVEKTLNNATLTITFTEPVNITANALINDESTPITIKNGICTLSLSDLPNSHYTINISFETNMEYEFREVSTAFDINAMHTRIIANPLTIYYNDGQFNITLLDENNNPLKSMTVHINLNNVKMPLTTNDDGMIIIESLKQYNLDVGSYTIMVSYDGGEKYFPTQNTTRITVLSSINLPQSKYALNSPYIATLYDNNGPIKDKQVKITMNGVTQTLSTDSNGQIRLNINLNPGSYSVAVENLETGEVKTQGIQVVPRLAGNSNIVMYYGAGKMYNVRAYDDNGQIAGAGEVVTFNVAGKNYNARTNNQGYASFKITLKAGNYKITATYKGFKVSNKITVKPTLITKNLKVNKGKKIKYQAKLFNTNGKALKGKKITFKIKGKTYKAKTNKKGIATIKIKNLKRGKYTVTVKYAKLTNKNKITVKK